MNVDPRFTTDAGPRLSQSDPIRFVPARWVPWREIAALGLATAIVCGACILWVDRPLAESLAGRGDAPWVAFFRVITVAGNSAFWYTPAAVAFAALLWRARHSPDAATRWEWRRRARAILFAVASMALSGTLVNVLKIAFGRYRPRFLFNEGIYDFAPFALALKHAGFPSGHSQSIVAAMVALGFLWPRGRVVFWAFAALVGASRFLTTVHYLSDVVAGAFVAVAVAWTLKRYFERNGIALAWAATRR